MSQTGSRRTATRARVEVLSNNYEAGEGPSHAPGRYPSPASVAGAGRRGRLLIPRQTEATAHPQIPHAWQALLKEWQNSASRMEFSVCPHPNHFVHSWAQLLLAFEQDDGHGLMPLTSLDSRKELGTHLVRGLRNEICAAFEALECSLPTGARAARAALVARDFGVGHQGAVADATVAPSLQCSPARARLVARLLDSR